MTILCTEQLVCGHAGQAVTGELTIELAAGEVAVLIGPNGAGKTTTLLTLAGVLTPIAGTVRLHDRATTAPLHLRARQGLSLVLDGRGVIAQLSVRDNLRLGAGPVARAVELFPELGERLRQRAGTLSGGEQQMLRLGRALAGDPQLLLLDELSAGLATPVAERLRVALRQAADRGAAALVVEQHQSLAQRLGDSGYVLGGTGAVKRETMAMLGARLSAPARREDRCDD
jgi:branched-chain amino acid transport system ATP-binding protein